MELKPSNNIFIFPGTTVVWQNKDSLPHKISGAGFHSGMLNPGEEFSHKFTKIAKYRYTDEFHPSIFGYVNVIDVEVDIESPDELVWVLVENYKFNPRTVEVKAGQYVVWENRDPMAHNVKGPTFASNALMGSKKFIHKFDQIGTYLYECTKHENEKAKIVVS